MFRFTKSLKVEGVDYAAGELVGPDELPAGAFQSCLRLGHVEPVGELAEPPPAHQVGREVEELRKHCKTLTICLELNEKTVTGLIERVTLIEAELTRLREDLGAEPAPVPPPPPPPPADDKAKPKK
jgi:hypothetical protein